MHERMIKYVTSECEGSHMYARVLTQFKLHYILGITNEKSTYTLAIHLT